MTVNKYVAVAYQDNWYPGCVGTLLNENEVLVNFMLLCKRNGYFQCPLRQDKQIMDCSRNSNNF